ncbi:hypothetical protein X798_00528 [Onchocerca flexuosa]|uniref:Recep_L_domain domain-containing protein n=2 Tax=Onchocerca flexuosa TaxID=387005 RepID=A0A183H3V6_9BILA|nr:hypothetical protein X798_00528 [Onchocerca flexuosa]VDO32077.1 unnamed protein product [Onchocerca flexuosa]
MHKENMSYGGRYSKLMKREMLNNEMNWMGELTIIKDQVGIEWFSQNGNLALSGLYILDIKNLLMYFDYMQISEASIGAKCEFIK